MGEYIININVIYAVFICYLILFVFFSCMSLQSFTITTMYIFGLLEEAGDTREIPRRLKKNRPNAHVKVPDWIQIDSALLLWGASANRCST